jgi:flagellar basal body-associated protein FliL
MNYFAVFKLNILFIMKKVLIVLVLFMAVLAVNAQVTKTTDTKDKGVRTPVMVADLLKPITDNIAKDYVGYTIKEAESVTKNNVVTYHVVVVKDATTMTLVYDKSGAFVKKLPPAPMKK